MTEVVEAPTRGRKADRDFSKFNEVHESLADYVNEHSDLDEFVTPNMVKAVLVLRGDFNKSPERAAQKEARAAEREAKNARYAGLSDDQKKAVQRAEKAAEKAAKLEAEAQALGVELG